MPIDVKYTGSRIPAMRLPQRAVVCPRTDCVYNRSTHCNNVFLGKGNGDSVCHKWSNKKLLALLDEIPSATYEELWGKEEAHNE